MNFIEIAKERQSCRSYDPTREVEGEKLEAILEAARLAPSACNGQPYHFTVCKGKTAAEVAKATEGRGINRFVGQAPILLVISERPCTVLPGLEDKLAENDWRSIDIGILSAYITAEATAQELGTCIIGCFENDRIQELCGLAAPVRLIITLGYAKEGAPLRSKKRKALAELVTVMAE